MCHISVFLECRKRGNSAHNELWEQQADRGACLMPLMHFAVLQLKSLRTSRKCRTKLPQLSKQITFDETAPKQSWSVLFIVCQSPLPLFSHCFADHLFAVWTASIPAVYFTVPLSCYFLLRWLSRQLRTNRVATVEAGFWHSFDMNGLAERGATCKMN